MSRRTIIGVLFLASFIISHTSLLAQLRWQRDDFEGTANRNWWRWYHDGPSTPFPDVKGGYLLLSLVDPTSTYNPYCDAAFWDGYPDPSGPYQEVRIKLRVKALNPHKYGSRGWGLWYTEDPPNLQRQAWFMQMLDDPMETGLEWWRAETSNGRTESTHHFVELDESPFNVDIQEWHTYEIIRETNYIELLIDGNSVLYTEDDLPTENMAFHIWVDNLIYEHVDPDIINIYKRGWTGKNEIVLDYVQIRTTGQFDSTETPVGVKLLREIPNEMGDGNSQFLWKNYNFDSPGGNNVLLITGRVEQYLDDLSQPISDDDDIRVVWDGQDYGWNTQNSLNGDNEGTISKTLLLEKNLTSGNKTVEVYGDISPLLYDVTVIGSAGGGIIFDQEYNETAPGGTDYLWKDIDFLSHAGEVAIYVSGSADEDSTPSPASRYGYQYSNFNDSECDHLRIVLDGYDYGYGTAYALWGNRQFGEPRSILTTENLSQGSHNLKIYAHNTPDLYRVVIYGENDEVRLPVKVFLEGAYTSGSMSTTLLSLGYLPLSQPYDAAPWNYAGMESVASIPADVVDWVLVELRSSTLASSIVGTRAAFLKSDGNIVDLDGTSPVKFAVAAGDYYIVIHHRNHLSIMSADVHLINSSSALYDFTTSMSSAYTSVSAPMKDLGGGMFGMFSSDANGDGQVTSSDFNVFNPAAKSAQTGYHIADWNLDGQVTSSDFNIFNPNAKNAVRTQVPGEVIVSGLRTIETKIKE